MHSSILSGIDAVNCEVEADVTDANEPITKLVEMADTAVKESVSRIQAALRNSGYRWPGVKVTINLAPADVKKDSAALDLPIALAVMVANGDFSVDKLDQYIIVGELALDGRVRPVKGVLATALLAAGENKFGVIVPAANATEAAVVESLDVIAVDYLTEAVGFLTDALPLEPYNVDLDKVFAVASQYDIDFADERGQESAKRALTIAAGGHHNILVLWPIYSTLRVIQLRPITSNRLLRNLPLPSLRRTWCNIRVRYRRRWVPPAAGPVRSVRDGIGRLCPDRNRAVGSGVWTEGSHQRSFRCGCRSV
ncbi:MAG: magnesium chelatase domain-containing protein [Phycisphaerae bacterium]|nr:magnesium chelatase domain-containing protein [Phycisphaerae bacterium]